MSANMSANIPLRRLWVVSLIACVLWLIVAGIVQAQTPDPSDRVHDIAKQLNCPTCAGRNLADCPTDTCMQWKQEIKDQLLAGKSQQEVLDYFQARFGPTVLQEPPKEGAILVLWVLPVIGLVALAAGGILVLRRVSAQRPKTANEMPVTSGQALDIEVEDEYVARLEEEVRKA
ncbi:MAG: cytochrome c-type biogenesis protein CcmH [Chloroflexi bacterium]|nr:cytochrome c-type biogenesis protein CcmH [Chloroflexota bacterium]